MSVTTLIKPTLTTSEEARINADNNQLMKLHIAALLDDPEALPPNPVTVFLPANDPTGLEEAVALALTYARDGYDVDLRHVHVRGRRPK